MVVTNIILRQLTSLYIGCSHQHRHPCGPPTDVVIRRQKRLLVLRGKRRAEHWEILQQLLESEPVFVVQVNNRRHLHHLTAWCDIQRKLSTCVRRFRRIPKHLIESAIIVRQ
ncbi:hypothetical protein DF156_16280 [Burkholderia ubonensis]|nr:hypothetical protein DF154_13840 [Burkholderia ubonensis]RQP40549.1 hypothetical protein DF156_16280 [Burkholderia ubonensis]RQP57425.1 hypothetical protein DF159_22375 [Burkholderia ubonensis]RQP59832.1 hypothetical protein DF151_15745 [Burkholderia ubonensis]